MCSSDLTKRILYTVVHSNAMNNISSSTEIVRVLTWWQILLIVFDIILGVIFVGGAVFFIIEYRKKLQASKELKTLQ